MISSKKPDTCIYNLLYVKFNEDMDRENYFSYSLEYPTFYNFENTYFHVDSNVLNNINSTIKTDVYTFKDGLLEEEKDFNDLASKNNLSKKNYKVFSDYAVTFNKNHILSTTLNLMGFDGDHDPLYNQINNYNFDLLTGNKVYLKDIFNQGVDYIKVITDYVNYKINQNKNWYYENFSIDISDDQAFYLTDDGIVIYFELGEIAPKNFGVPKFKILFDKFAPYINPRFYCIAQNVNYFYRRKYRVYR
ncbi:DUF3298 and DUF4163 domain-containing protein [Romboutsia sp.]|uniref:DUF3298 and DUF4163 domain-containing protein n=1 Tax=Romboutsia sp. TaxID=1965302 RepID=UPI002BDABEC1|nr:DUF3298 domain-containing protein [Romboutsia sp.]HSQ88512.1 DUF3298 domain-containing protein [Romboutsia sp.]